MNTQTTKQQELFFLWIQGSLIKLAELGFILASPEPLTEEQWKEYNEVDENRDLIPDIALEVMFIGFYPDYQKNIQDIVLLLCQYKNNRTELTKYYLEFLMSK
jgi:hypothetical protein